jgi:asparagine synthetase B (glutamine-hydrolysing)
VLLNGSVFTSSPSPHRLGASDILTHYAKDGKLRPEQYDGSFVIVLFDRKRSCVRICNDRLGTLPLYYMSGNDKFSFGPEVKGVLSAMGAAARLSVGGVVNFVSCGYCLAGTTLFENVHYLTPATILTVNLTDLSVRSERYWKMSYEPDESLRSRPSAEEALYEAIRGGHQLILSDNPEKYDLLLSGGLDSRGILAFLSDIGRRPTRTFGWGMSSDIRNSDPEIAARLAEAYGLRFDFISYDTDRFLSNARSWCYISELQNDNIGWYAEGASVLARDYLTDGDCSLTGDECLGGGGHVDHKQEAIGEVLPPELPPAFREMLHPAVLPDCEAVYKQRIEDILCGCDSENALDQRGFLYLNARLARFVFSLGYYKELAVELRRPLLTGDVVEVIRHLPGTYRVHKNLFVSMMKRYLPEAMHLPTNSVDSLPDWENDIREKPDLREFFLDLLDAKKINAGILGTLIDIESLERIKSAFMESAGVRRRMWRTKARHLLPADVRRRSRSLDQLRKLLGRSGALQVRTRKTFDVLRCLALITLLEEQLDRFDGQDTH